MLSTAGKCTRALGTSVVHQSSVASCFAFPALVGDQRGEHKRADSTSATRPTNDPRGLHYCCIFFVAACLPRHPPTKAKYASSSAFAAPISAWGKEKPFERTQGHPIPYNELHGCDLYTFGTKKQPRHVRHVVFERKKSITIFSLKTTCRTCRASFLVIFCILFFGRASVCPNGPGRATNVIPNQA